MKRYPDEINLLAEIQLSQSAIHNNSSWGPLHYQNRAGAGPVLHNVCCGHWSTSSAPERQSGINAESGGPPPAGAMMPDGF
uniref:Uncharacterized protein n=1 Tax=Anguilla anguilla TaxID=7936 RepID=A0A0E9TL51_ANGAN